MRARQTAPASRDAEPHWYRDAIIYELRVRSFYDSDGDGVGDLRGLTEKLGYLQDLGVTAVWLLPFYPSPLRDDGYDISDYTGVHPEYGTLADFERFLAEAHRRGMRVITELVLNHTSDQHPWFQQARRAPPGSPERAFYVWSDTPARYEEARIIFQDFEPSNWSWDPVARAYYWHRFYAHQPDLNYDNPAVREAMLRVVDFWLGMGVDGMRLDAVPYLFEREGTPCENLPETHEFLRELRAHIDARFPDRMLLAEANQWPEDAVAYFGRGDECHMAFHFPMMPRLFVAVQMEDRFPIYDILAQTPQLPPGCQWALFLRNHDELTLEMVTDEERDAMVRAYASEPVMRINLGIRRRLAPLAGNQRRRIELMNALLFSLPGTPVIYYGDEVGMGDNVYLGDRNGVRTPMQWSADKNAGFSRAAPQKLVLPVILEPGYHYEAVNVEKQQEDPGSLLWWTKRLVALRKRHAAFGRGTLELCHHDNPHVLAFVRRYESDDILVVANLSRFVQHVEIDLGAWKGSAPVELFGGSPLGTVGDAPYPLTLAGHGFYWIALGPRPRDEARAAAYEPPALDASWLPTLAAPEALAPDQSTALAELLALWVRAQPWFAGRRRRLDCARLLEVAPVGDPPLARVVALELAFEEGDAERYLMAIALADAARSAEVAARARQSLIATVEAPEGARVLHDALTDPPSARALVEVLFTLARGGLAGRGGVIVAGEATLPVARADATPMLSAVVPPSVLTVGGEHFFADVVRKLDDEGPSPGLETSRFLAARGTPAPVPALAGAVEYVPRRAAPIALVVLRAFVPGESDCFSSTVAEVHRFFERALARARHAEAPPVPRWSVLRLLAEEPDAPVRDMIGAFLDTAALLGRRTAELSAALADSRGSPAFAPEPWSPHDQRGAYQSMRNLAGRSLREIERVQRSLCPGDAELAAIVLSRREEALRRFGALIGRRPSSPRTRIVGALDLGKVLHTGNDFVFLDLDGDRRRPAAERRRKASALRDAAGIVRSLHEATFSALLDPARVRAEDVEAARPWASAFWGASASAFLRAYVSVAGEHGLLRDATGEIGALLDAFLLESAFAALGTALEEHAAPARLSVGLSLLAALLESRDGAS